MRIMTIVAAVLLSAAVVFSQRRSQTERTTFQAEEAFEAAVEMPADVLELLQQDEDTQRCLSERESLKQAPANWFSASEVTLTSVPRTGLVVTREPLLVRREYHPFLGV